jgi:GNAT superfamily N-acetyltransferase
MNAAKYAATENLRNGASLQIRALLPGDRAEMLAAVGRFSQQTLYRRFFAPKRRFSEREIEFFLNVDFIGHVALVAVLSEGGRQVIAGGARYVRAAPGCAEVAFAIDDPHQKLGIATHLIRHLIEIARANGLEEFIAEVLSDKACSLPRCQDVTKILTIERPDRRGFATERAADASVPVVPKEP